MTSLALSDVDLRTRCEDLADDVIKLRLEAEKWELRAEELAEDRNLWRTRYEAASAGLSLLEGAARRVLDARGMGVQPSAWGALEFALREVVKATGGGR